jgi:hypothetical protein
VTRTAHSVLDGAVHAIAASNNNHPKQHDTGYMSWWVVGGTPRLLVKQKVAPVTEKLLPSSSTTSNSCHPPARQIAVVDRRTEFLEEENEQLVVYLDGAGIIFFCIKCISFSQLRPQPDFLDPETCWQTLIINTRTVHGPGTY